MPTNKSEEKWKQNLIKATEKARNRGLPQHVIVKHVGIPTKRALEIAESLGYKYGDGLTWWNADPTCFDIFVNKDVVLTEEKRNEYNSILHLMKTTYDAVFSELEELETEKMFGGDRSAYEQCEEPYDSTHLLNGYTLPAEDGSLLIDPNEYRELSKQEIINLIAYDLREHMWRFRCEELDNGTIKAYLERTF